MPELSSAQTTIPSVDDSQFPLFSLVSELQRKNKKLRKQRNFWKRKAKQLESRQEGLFQEFLREVSGMTMQKIRTEYEVQTLREGLGSVVDALEERKKKDGIWVRLGLSRRKTNR